MNYFAAIIVSTFLSFIIQQCLTNSDFFDTFGPFYEQYIIPTEYNSIIDLILTNTNCKIGKKLIITQNRVIPYWGKHYYYSTNYSHPYDINNLNYVTFEKKETGKDNEIIKYTLYVNFFVKYFKNDAFSSVIKEIYSTDRNAIQSISIDTSQYTLDSLIVSKTYHQPTHVQSLITDNILDHYEKTRNVKALITGSMGIGKTYIANVIKRTIDEKYGVNSKLFEDFNPSITGLNIKTKVLSHATEFTPVIIVINEYDIMLDKVTQDKQFQNDPRLTHTQNKLTFNQMLDDIANTKYVIAIFTSEKNINILKQNTYHLSFLRRGRIDYNINMYENHFDSSEI
jgi:hypothetical protein